MSNLDKVMQDVRDEFRHMLLQYRDVRGARLNIVSSLWMINRMIELHNATKSIIERQNVKKKTKAR
ncbi:MAG: hypothetical protein K2I81_02860 [Alphaproteobacteria bacterium]|nr:hypothetical protein [Alphaproteobacteria bacterium]